MRTITSSKITKILIAVIITLTAVIATPYIFNTSVEAQQDTCPKDGDWEKIEPIDQQSYTYTAPEGKVIVESCYKAGNILKTKTYDPGQTSVTVTTDVPNPNDNNFQDISHASFKLATKPTEEPKEDQPFVRVTYICAADAAGIVEGYGLNVEPGDHIWRIRHESGPATDFSTNFLSDVQGHIEVGQTLFFVTKQSANGVKVITSPLENLYKGTASVSGSICDVPEEPKEEQPFVRVTYICAANAAGIVEGYGLSVQPGDHIWRIRHESGPATNFSTNFLSDVQGHIEVGQTLFFVTQQNANGVKVITSPLDNLYKGTASVSGSTCTIPEDPKEEGDLTVTPECLGNGSIEWTVVNATKSSVSFDWKTTNKESGSGQVAADSFTTFTTTTDGFELTLTYQMDNQELELNAVADVCEDPKETDDPSGDPSPDVAAGGFGPSLVATIAPFALGLTGLGTGAALVINLKKKK
ncbi:hypothetical protein KQH56_01125 [bacterium]|nr:hypothetical protein [bacterium]